MNKLITLQSAIEILKIEENKHFNCGNYVFANGLREASRVIKKLPLIQSSSKKGQWIEVGVCTFDDMQKSYKCSVCEKEIKGDIIGWFDFCHKCGADMREDNAK